MEAEAGTQKPLRPVQRQEFLERGLPLLVDAPLASFLVDQHFGLGRGPVVVEVGVEEAGVELVEGRGVGGRDVSPAHVFAHDGRVFGLHQTVVAALAGTAFGLLDEQFLQQLSDGFVDELAAVVGVEVEDEKGELQQQALQQGQQPGLGNARRGQHHLPLRHLVDGVDVVDALALRAVALMHGVEAQKPGLGVGRGLFALADGHRRGPGLLVAAQAVTRAAAQVVEVAVGELGQALELGLAVDLKLSPQDVPRGRAAEPVVGRIDRGQQLHVRRRVMARETRPRRGLERDPSAAHIAANQPRGLRPAESGHVLDVGPQQPFGPPLLPRVLVMAEQPLHPVVNLRAITSSKPHTLRGGKKRLDLNQTQLLRSQHADHPPSACPLQPPSGSSCVGIHSLAQAHLALDKSPA